MKIQQRAIVRRLEREGITRSDVCNEAGIDRTTLWRWLVGPVPPRRSLDAVHAAIDRIVARRSKKKT